MTVLVAACSSSGGAGGSGGTTGAPAPISTQSGGGQSQAQPTDASGRVAQWYAGVAGLFAAIQVDTEHIKDDATKQDVRSLSGHCTNLRTDAAKVQGAAAAPDKRIAAAVATAMSAYASAAQSCLQGNFPATAAAINQGAAALESANSIMNNMP
jgi:hypothetical protein